MTTGEVLRGRPGRQALCLVWSSGTDAAKWGWDLISMIRRLPDSRLVFWYRRYAGRALPFETGKLRDEIRFRGLSLHEDDQAGQRLLF